MTNKQTIDGVSRELLERALRELLDWESADEFAGVKRTHEELRALLDTPAGPTKQEAWALQVEKDLGIERLPAAQPQGEPAPITCDMSRLMEAHRLGEFDCEGGSNTVEALSVASFGSVESHGHDADSYMAGFCAAMYEQAKPFIQLALKPDTQGEVERLTEQYEKLWSDFVSVDDENEKLRMGMKGDYDLDSWLGFVKERDTLRAQLADRDALLRRAGLMFKSIEKELRAFHEACPEQWRGHLDDALGGAVYQFGQIDAALSTSAEPTCCVPTAEEEALLNAGEYTPEELWGGRRPTCPKCFKAEKNPAPVAVVLP